MSESRKPNIVLRCIAHALSSDAVLIVATLGALVLALSMSGCNTVKGFAKDVYSVTEGIQNEMSTDSARDGSRPDNWD